MDSAGARSVISTDMQNLGQGEENISNAISGHKANLSNPSQSVSSPILPPNPSLFCYITSNSSHTNPLTYGPDTSTASKTKSEQAIKDLGGESAQDAATGDNSASETAKENLS